MANEILESWRRNNVMLTFKKGQKQKTKKYRPVVRVNYKIVNLDVFKG